jgi:hypothetical protein
MWTYAWVASWYRSSKANTTRKDTLNCLRAVLRSVSMPINMDLRLRGPRLTCSPMKSTEVDNSLRQLIGLEDYTGHLVLLEAGQGLQLPLVGSV